MVEDRILRYRDSLFLSCCCFLAATATLFVDARIGHVQVKTEAMGEAGGMNLDAESALYSILHILCNAE